MQETAATRISSFLRRDTMLVAREAVRLFAGQLDVVGEGHAEPGSGAPFRRNSHAPSGTDEAEAIIYDAIVRLGSVVALSLQVDEPKLLAEELQWLDLTIGHRLGNSMQASYLDVLTAVLVDACRNSLDENDCNALKGFFIEARNAVSTLEPLLTDTHKRSHFEGTTTEDN